MHVADEVESPYSPPDSDGTPLGSPSEQRTGCSLVLTDVEGRRPTADNQLEETEVEYVAKRLSASPVRLVFGHCHLNAGPEQCVQFCTE